MVLDFADCNAPAKRHRVVRPDRPLNQVLRQALLDGEAAEATMSHWPSPGPSTINDSGHRARLALAAPAELDLAGGDPEWCRDVRRVRRHPLPDRGEDASQDRSNSHGLSRSRPTGLKEGSSA
jgi:hypothetical protein